MPFYEYQCIECGHRLEALQKISDAPLVECPECNAGRLKKLISAAGFRLKGTGWYETDFKNSAKKDSTSKDSTSKDGATNDSSTSGSESSKSAGADSATSSKPVASKSESSAST